MVHFLSEFRIKKTIYFILGLIKGIICLLPKVI